MVNMLRLGIVGCGGIATDVHIPNWLALKDRVRLFAVCDQNENLSKQTAKKFGIDRSYKNLSDMLDAENLDIVDICTPPQTHAALAIDAMNAGCNVITEKPMALSTEEADKIIAASEKNKVKFCIVHNFLFEPMFQEAKHLAESGLIGELRGVESEMSIVGTYLQKGHWVHDLPGGIFSELAPHPIYLSLEFLENIHSVHAIFKKFCSFPWVAADEMRAILEAKMDLELSRFPVDLPKMSLLVGYLERERC
jgi:predicted dehydrogenase